MENTIHPDLAERRHTPDRRGLPALRGAASALGAADWVALAMLVIGGLSFGARGLFGVDPVVALFSEGSVLERLLCLLIGVSAVFASLYTANKIARRHG